MNASSVLFGAILGLGFAVAVDHGVIRIDLSRIVPKTQHICGNGNCSVQNPLGNAPSVGDFFESIGGPSDGHVDHYLSTPDTVPAIPKAAPKVPRAYQAPLPNGISGSNSEPQVYYLPIPVPVEIPSGKVCS